MNIKFLILTICNAINSHRISFNGAITRVIYIEDTLVAVGIGSTVDSVRLVKAAIHLHDVIRVDSSRCRLLFIGSRYYLIEHKSFRHVRTAKLLNGIICPPSNIGEINSPSGFDTDRST